MTTDEQVVEVAAEEKVGEVASEEKVEEVILPKGKRYLSIHK